jgi:hypothetical protein
MFAKPGSALEQEIINTIDAEQRRFQRVSKCFLAKIL